ncbi:DUF1127 domain-containing protein [Celeribacter persicus]|jgi:Uncharacterized conserved small protein|uniref:Uncharacterized protein YjiS (DUF1127 family) n=1 Tax=Celeribacter persicus TaxID=1651082 RepID=A0A2T5HWS0_9RHOB|nr:DUF1127 domain-containing protein [Celeribacter persicus]PTQ76039.1 uncharacterized protein YjiS (DUF1127 family) [Celeribacter persicus]
MAHFTDTTRASGFGYSLRTMFARLREAHVRQRAFTETYNQLNALSDHELHDIGLGRSDIMDIARQTAARV